MREEQTGDLVIDATFVRAGRVGGAENMLKNLVTGIVDLPDPPTIVILSAESPWLVSDRVRWIGAPHHVNRFIGSTLALQGLRTRALLCPNYFTPPGASRHAERVVTVIHDLQYRHFPEYFSRRKRLWLRRSHEASLRRADTVVAISQSVYDDIVRSYGSAFEPKLVVIENPVDWARFTTSAASAEASRADETPYVLSVAAHYPHKNLERLIAAMKLVRRHPRLGSTRLVLVGQTGARLLGTRGAFLDTSEPWITETGHVSDAELGELYEGAALMAFPTLFEGFGMPVVEALGLGVPVVTSNIAPLPDVSDGLARYVDDVRDVAQIARGLVDVLLDPDAWRPDAAARENLRARFDVRRVSEHYRRVLLQAASRGSDLTTTVHGTDL